MTRGVPTPPTGLLPYDDFPVTWRRVVLQACRVAWLRLSKAAADASVDLGTFSEDELTSRMKNVLNVLRDEEPSPVPGFSPATFEHVVRDAVVETFDGGSLDKKPDLVFRPIQLTPGLWLSEHRGLFTECKIVDKSAHPIGLYCKKGLRRFVDGEYAWAMRSGLMIAYARDSRTVSSTLRNALLRARKAKTSDPYRTRGLPKAKKELGAAPSAYSSTHRRSWRYLNGEKPGDIEIVHLWLVWGHPRFDPP